MIGTIKPRLAGQGPSEVFAQRACYYRVTIEYGLAPDSCFKVASHFGAEAEIREALPTLSPYFNKHKGEVTKIKIQDWPQFSAVLTRNV